MIEAPCFLLCKSEPLKNKRRDIAIMIFVDTITLKTGKTTISLMAFEAQILWVSSLDNSRDPALGVQKNI